MSKCGLCGHQLKELLTSTYCPNGCEDSDVAPQRNKFYRDGVTVDLASKTITFPQGTYTALEVYYKVVDIFDDLLFMDEIVPLAAVTATYITHRSDWCVYDRTVEGLIVPEDFRENTIGLRLLSCDDIPPETMVTVLIDKSPQTFVYTGNVLVLRVGAEDGPIHKISVHAKGYHSFEDYEVPAGYFLIPFVKEPTCLK